MHLIKENFLRVAAAPRSKAGRWLETWIAVVKCAEWRSIHDVRQTYPSADPVKVASGRCVTIFNVCGNDYRLIVAIHCDKRRIYTLRFMRHAEYDKNHWKNGAMNTNTKITLNFKAMPHDYAALCGVLPPRPIHDAVDYRNTVEVADVFAGFQDRMTADQHDYFDLLCHLIEKYDSESVKHSELTASALLKHLLVEHGLAGASLSRILGKSASLGPMILRGDRKITADHAVRLGNHFKLRPDAFLR